MEFSHLKQDGTGGRNRWHWETEPGGTLPILLTSMSPWVSPFTSLGFSLLIREMGVLYVKCVV